MRGFLAHLYLRPACGVCSFKQIGRQSDITMADFWGIEKTKSRFNDNKGTSLVMVHSAKGEEIFTSLSDKVSFEKSDYDFATADNASYLRSAHHSFFREEFFKSLDNNSIEKLVDRYCGDSIVSKIRRKVARMTKIRK